MKVTYKRHWGTDLDVVNNARVSFDKESEWENVATDQGHGVDYGGYPDAPFRKLSAPDKSLIKFLARGCTSGDWDAVMQAAAECAYVDHGEIKYDDDLETILNHVRKMPQHWLPFANGIGITLHFKVPMFVQRQLDKHQVGFTTSEMSRRYVTSEPEFYVPDVWRKASDNVKQGSSDDVIDGNGLAIGDYNYVCDMAVSRYQYLIDCGVCPEQARMVLPQSMYVESIKSGSLYGWANLYNQRSDSHAQKETQQVAEMVKDIIAPLYPESWGALTT